MDKVITIKIPMWFALKAMQALQRSDPMGLWSKREMDSMAGQIEEEIRKSKEHGAESIEKTESRKLKAETKGTIPEGLRDKGRGKV